MNAPHFEIFVNKKAFGKKSRPKITSSQRKSKTPTKKLIVVVWSSIKRLRDQMNAPQQEPILKKNFNEKSFGKNIAPELHRVSEKALMPPRKLINVG